ncbi:HTH-type transcriptional regulator GltR [Usitatibacter rugosus]|uniref:HTH-type transcriptional regulator GltR n=1 Tax=Usitatibacter rugosus TaxID=2732067 RepID=A0A6M4H114_9PROT|nr:LysR family transcriptional regulator [Usitatibacter rugosus]QJR13186.1 HTH-type transcriptional regulator GltR [Usitatibacter rugosus]
MTTLDLESLHIFRTVAEEGGITRAAAKLNRVQSNVTTRVKQLEEHLGTQLFQRHARKLTLSPEGRVLLAYTEELLRLSHEAQSAVKSGTPRGVFRVGTLESTAATRLPPVLSKYHLAYPDVQIELATGTSGALVARVLAYELEAAFVAEPFTAEGLDMLHVFDEELVLISPKGVAPRTVIAFPGGCSYRRRLEDWLGKEAVVASRVIEFASYHAIIACVAAGTGIAIVPRSVLRIVGAERQVVVKELPARIARAKTQLVWRQGHHSVALGALRQLVGA